MKKLCILLFIASMALSLVACSSQAVSDDKFSEASLNESKSQAISSMISGKKDPEPVYSGPSSTVTSSHTPYWLPPIDNDKPLNELLSDYKISNEDLETLWAGYRASSISSTRGFIEDINKQYPISFVRKIDARSYYTVFNTEAGGLIYMFFSSTEDDTEQKERIMIFRASTYMEKNLSFSDFSFIKKGSSFQDVVKIDPSVKRYPDRDALWRKLMSDSTTHLLSDGVLCIYYDPDNFIVTEVEFKKEFLYQDRYSSTDKPVNFHIFSKDYINR